MPRVTRPPHGSFYRVSRGYVDGTFIIDGARARRTLGKLAELERNASGRVRNGRQLNAAVATRWEAKRLEIEEALPELGATPMSDVFKDWIERAEARGRAKETLRAHKLTRDYYRAIVGDHPVEELVGTEPMRRPGYDLEHADAFQTGLAAKGLSPARINTYLGRLASALRYAERRHLLTRAPSIERVKETRRPRRVPDPAHIRAIRRRLIILARWGTVGLDAESEPASERQWRRKPSAADRYHYRLQRLMFYVLLFTGVRPMEANAIERSQVYLPRRAILLRTTKTGTVRVVRIGRFLTGKLRAHMAAHPGRALLFEDFERKGQHAWRDTAAIGTAFARHMRELGISGTYKRLYGYRAGFSTIGLNDVQVSAEAMKAQMGHADLQTTLDHYVAGLDNAQLAMIDAMEARAFRPLFGRSVGDEAANAHAKRV